MKDLILGCNRPIRPSNSVAAKSAFAKQGKTKNASAVSHQGVL